MAIPKSRSIKKKYYKKNPLRQLQGFCYAAQNGSISKAAERMQLSQPSVSLQIQALEQELGATLFERRGPYIQLTPAGRTLYEIALPLVTGFDNLAETFNIQRDNLDSGEVSIAAGESTILYLLPKIAQRFSEDYPKIRMRFHNVTGQQGLAALREDTVDFAVGSFRSVPDDMSYQPMYSFEQVLIMPPKHPLAGLAEVSLADISPFQLILPPRHLHTFSMVEMTFQQHNLPLNVHLETGGWEVIKKYVALGLGISIVSAICLSERDEFATCSLDCYFPKRSYGIITRRGKFLSPQARQFIEYIDSGFFARIPR